MKPALIPALLGLLGALLIAGCIGQPAEYHHKYFSLMPPSGWSMEEGVAGAAVIFTEPAKKANIRVSLFPSNATLEAFTADYKAALPGMMAGMGLAGFAITSERARTIAGIPAYELVYTGTLKEVAITGKQVYLISKGNVFFITLTAQPADFAAADAIFEGVLGSFKVK